MQNNWVEISRKVRLPMEPSLYSSSQWNIAATIEPWDSRSNYHQTINLANRVGAGLKSEASPRPIRVRSAASSRGSTVRVGTSPDSPSGNPRSEASGLSCSRRLRPRSSGQQSCSIPTPPPHRLLCPHLRRPRGHSRSWQFLRQFVATKKSKRPSTPLGASREAALSDVSMTAHRAPIILAAAPNNVPAIYPQSFFVRGGGLLSYGADFVESLRRAATYVDRILLGAKPGDLPVQFPTNTSCSSISNRERRTSR